MPWPWSEPVSSSPEPGGGQALRPWPLLRALLIALVLLVHGTKAMPWPDVRPRDLDYGVAQDELARWAGIFTAAGHPITQEELAQRVLAVGRGSAAVQRALHGPFKPLLDLTGTGQAWGLFAYPDPYAGRLVVSVKRLTRGGLSGWEVVYRAPREGEDWLVDLLEYRRVRGIYDDNGDRPKPGIFYDRLCDWLATEIMARRQDVAEVQVRLDLVTNRVPGDRRPAVPDQRRHLRRRDRQDVADRLALRGAPDRAVVAGGGADASQPQPAPPVGP